MQEKPRRGLFAKGFFEKLLYFLLIDRLTQDKVVSLFFFNSNDDHKNVSHTLKQGEIQTSHSGILCCLFAFLFHHMMREN